MRILGVDWGRARTGLALSDPCTITCSPLPPIAERDPEHRLQELISIIAEEGVEQVVIGLPRPLRGGDNQQTLEVREFVERLRALTSVPVLAWDERYTTRLAERARFSNASRDSVAACYILQSYLDWLSRSSGEEKPR